jgi:uncharacterized membrane protein
MSGIPARTGDGPAGSFPGDANVHSVERLLSVAGGSALVAWGLYRRGLSGFAQAAVGAALLKRGFTGRCEVFTALGISTAEADDVAAAASRTLEIQEALTVDRAAGELYAAWREPTRVAGFMSHLQLVEHIDDRHVRWRYTGPLGLSLEWEVELVADVPGQLVAWRSVAGAAVRHSGEVRFRPAPSGRGTEVAITLHYAPRSGARGAGIGRLFGAGAELRIREDLRRFKRQAEAGEIR